MKRLTKSVLAVVLAATLFVGFAQQDGDIPTRIVLGMVPSRDMDTIVDNLTAIGEMLSAELLIPVETFVATSYVGVVEAMANGRVDIGMFGPAGVVQAVDLYDAVPILSSVRQGSLTYRAQFNVRCDSGITDFQQLRGGTIAWVSPSSASGYQFPFATLSSIHGIDPNTEMTGVFAGSHDASMLLVYMGDVDVAVTFGGSPGSDGRTTIEADYPDVMEQVCILGYSADIPNDGTVVRAGLDSGLVEQITQALIDIAQSEEGNVHTQALFNVTDFVRFDDFDATYAIVREVSRTFER